MSGTTNRELWAFICDARQLVILVNDWYGQPEQGVPQSDAKAIACHF
jgi:hypothetical protein